MAENKARLLKKGLNVWESTLGDKEAREAAEAAEAAAALAAAEREAKKKAEWKQPDNTFAGLAESLMVGSIVCASI